MECHEGVLQFPQAEPISNHLKGTLVNVVQAGAWVVVITLCEILGGGASAGAADTGGAIAHNLLANGDAEAHRCTSDWGRDWLESRTSSQRLI